MTWNKKENNQPFLPSTSDISYLNFVKWFGMKLICKYPG